VRRWALSRLAQARAEGGLAAQAPSALRSTWRTHAGGSLRPCPCDCPATRDYAGALGAASVGGNLLLRDVVQLSGVYT
jgi:hypothetical protein